MSGMRRMRGAQEVRRLWNAVLYVRRGIRQAPNLKRSASHRRERTIETDGVLIAVREMSEFIVVVTTTSQIPDVVRENEVLNVVRKVDSVPRQS